MLTLFDTVIIAVTLIVGPMIAIAIFSFGINFLIKRFIYQSSPSPDLAGRCILSTIGSMVVMASLVACSIAIVEETDNDYVDLLLHVLLVAATVMVVSSAVSVAGYGLARLGRGNKGTTEIALEKGGSVRKDCLC